MEGAGAGGGSSPAHRVCEGNSRQVLLEAKPSALWPPRVTGAPWAVSSRVRPCQPRVCLQEGQVRKGACPEGITSTSQHARWGRRRGTRARRAEGDTATPGRGKGLDVKLGKKERVEPGVAAAGRRGSVHRASQCDELSPPREVGNRGEATATVATRRAWGRTPAAAAQVTVLEPFPTTEQHPEQRQRAPLGGQVNNGVVEGRSSLSVLSAGPRRATRKAPRPGLPSAHTRPGLGQEQGWAGSLSCAGGAPAGPRQNQREKEVTRSQSLSEHFPRAYCVPAAATSRVGKHNILPSEADSLRGDRHWGQPIQDTLCGDVQRWKTLWRTRLRGGVREGSQSRDLCNGDSERKGGSRPCTPQAKSRLTDGPCGCPAITYLHPTVPLPQFPHL